MEPKTCSEIECEPPFGGKSDCEFNHNGTCIGNSLPVRKSGVIASIHPRHCANISAGFKTLELRKNKPKLAVPFTVYVYCTKGDQTNPHEVLEIHDGDGHIHRGNGHVVGEFTCDKVTPIHVLNNGDISGWDFRDLDASCVSYDDIADYIGWGNTGYAWHISNFILYKKPLDIEEFLGHDCCPYTSPNGCTYPYHCFRAGQSKRCGDTISRVPQSWCYTDGRIASSNPTKEYAK